MAYRLDFTESDGPVFEAIYNGFHVTARPSSREQHRITNAVLDKLEGISTNTDFVIPGFDQRDPSSPRQRLLTGTWIILEDNQYEFLKKCLDNIQTPAAMSRTIERMFMKLDTARHGDAKQLCEG